MADALYAHPYLQGYRSLIVGHTDATGSRERNLKLSQERADAIREALIKPFGISPARIEAVGLGESSCLIAAISGSGESSRAINQYREVTYDSLVAFLPGHRAI